MLLALQALDQADTLEARNALHQALPELHLLHTIAAHKQTPGVAANPDGTRWRVWASKTSPQFGTLRQAKDY